MSSSIDHKALQMPTSPSTSTRRASNHEMEDLIPIDKVVILYASETGNSQDTAERVGREFRRYGKRCTVMSMELFDVVSLNILVMDSSTDMCSSSCPILLW
jgi:sulfite reductase alpha subunit-like flavoprotein